MEWGEWGLDWVGSAIELQMAAGESGWCALPACLSPLPAASQYGTLLLYLGESASLPDLHMQGH